MKAQHIQLAVLIAALSITLASCTDSDARTGEGQDSNGAKAGPNGALDRVVNVQVQEIQPTPFIDAIQVAGIIKAYEDVKLSPEEGGVVKEWKVEKGRWVTKGQILAVLKDDVLQASYDAAAAQYRAAELNYDKQSKVFAEQAVSELQLKSSEFTRDAARAQMELALARLERTRLRSPIDGILNDRFVNEGEFAPPAVPIAHIVNVSRVKLAAEVPETYASQLFLGAPVTFTVDAWPGDTLSGKIGFLGAAVSPTNRTLPIEVVLPNPQRKLKPEMMARVKIFRSSQKNALLISESVVQMVDRNRYVVYVENMGRAEERIVKLGGRQGNRVEVVEGLRAGDRIIVAGFQKLVNGQPVDVVGKS